MSLPAVDYGKMPSQDPDCFVSLHSPDGPEISVGGYERQPIGLISKLDSDSYVLANKSRIEFPPFDSRVSIGYFGVCIDDELVAGALLDREYTVEPDTIVVFSEGELTVAVDDLPPDVIPS